MAVCDMATNMSEAPMWDERYSTEEYVFGTDPAAFRTQHEELFVPGSETLVVADGEGRNSVYLATRGMQVTAMDVSEVGVEKARRLAIDRGATVDFRLPRRDRRNASLQPSEGTLADT